MKKRQLILILLVTLAGGINLAVAQGTAFTYQGMLTDSGGPLNGFYDLTFALYDSGPGPGGNPVGSPNSSNNVKVSGGLVTTSLDFGSGAFNGQPRWLEITVHPHAGGATTTLSPRQPLLPAPYAIFAANAGGSGPGIWSLNGANAYYNGGNVGIGTSTPASLLDVFDGSLHTWIDGDSISFSRTGGPAYIAAQNRIDFVTDGRSTTDGNANLVLQADQTSYFNGNLGIGTGAPRSTLDVNGNIIATPNDHGNPANIVLTAASVDGTALYCHSYGTPFHAHNDYTSTDVYLAGGDAAVFTGDISVNGNVDIGTSSAGGKLHVFGTSAPGGRHPFGHDCAGQRRRIS